MGNFREWISDNLRYILLGLAIILILVVAVFAVKLVSGLGSESGSGKATEAESGTTKQVTSESNASAENQNNQLIKDDPTVLGAVQAYYAAMGSKDMEALRKLVPALTAEEEQNITNDDLIESYNNISTYSKKGPVAGSHVVYVMYDCKVANIDTQVPSLVRLYLQTNESNSLYVADFQQDEATKKFIDDMSNEQEVKKLVEDVNKKYQEALNSNESLKNLVDQIGSPVSESTIPNSDEAGVEVQKVVAANTECNVRADSSEEADILGVLSEGEKITRVRKLDNGWSEVKYGGGTAYVMSEFLSEQTDNSGTQE